MRAFTVFPRLPVPKAHALPSATIDPQLLAGLRACADGARLAILRLLAEDAYSVQELGTILGLGQATVSHHLKALGDAGLLRQQRDGTHRFYRRAQRPSPPGPGDRTFTTLFEELDAAPLGPALEAGVAQVIADRGARSRAFFERNAEAFEASQDLIALPDRYLPVLTEWLPARGAQALEIGPGLGEFLPTLLGRFDTVWAVDRSEEMLRRCAQRLAKDGDALPHFHCGAFEHLDGQEAAARDHRVVVLAMVLHHSQTPAALTRAAVRALAADGELLIAELSPHEQAWVGDACGDLWLGIAPEDQDRWAQDAGARLQERQFLTLRNGFQIHLSRYRRHPDPLGAAEARR